MLDWQLELTTKTPNLTSLQAWLTANPQEISYLVENLHSTNDTLRFNSFLLAQMIAADQGLLLYAYWDNFASLLMDENNFFRSIGIQLLALLSPFDREEKFELIKDGYFSHLHSGSIMTIRYLIQSMEILYRSKPALRAYIMDVLLHLEKYVNLQQERIDLAKCDVLIVFEALWPTLDNQAELRQFAEEALQAKSAKTQKQARAFLKKFGA
jgi:hypothetical protein